MIGHSVGAFTHAPHGFALAAVSLPYYKLVMPYGLAKFKRFAEYVWAIDLAGKTDTQIAEEGIEALKVWMLEIGLPLTISELGATDAMLQGIAKGTITSDAGYHELTFEEVIRILKESM